MNKIMAGNKRRFLDFWLKTIKKIMNHFFCKCYEGIINLICLVYFCHGIRNRMQQQGRGVVPAFYKETS